MASLSEFIYFTSRERLAVELVFPMLGHIQIKGTNNCLSLKQPLGNPPYTVTDNNGCYDGSDGKQVFYNWVMGTEGPITFAGGWV